ncbi:hypothetical protein QM201_25925 [Enterobacter asburiae]|nr:hypothetical protein [Enterobacter asburiae]
MNKRKLGFMVGKGSIPDDKRFDEVDAELDQKILELFYPGEVTASKDERSEAGEGTQKGDQKG